MPSGIPSPSVSISLGLVPNSYSSKFDKPSPSISSTSSPIPSPSVSGDVELMSLKLSSHESGKPSPSESNGPDVKPLEGKAVNPEGTEYSTSPEVKIRYVCPLLLEESVTAGYTVVFARPLLPYSESQAAKFPLESSPNIGIAPVLGSRLEVPAGAIH